MEDEVISRGRCPGCEYPCREDAEEEEGIPPAMELHLGVTWGWLPEDCQVLCRVRMDSEPDMEFSCWFGEEEEGMSWSLEMLWEKLGAMFEMRLICG